jgi:hypothetical protein
MILKRKKKSVQTFGERCRRTPKEIRLVRELKSGRLHVYQIKIFAIIWNTGSVASGKVVHMAGTGNGL